jgi:exodeoxyribonuclease V beta subunit
MSETTKEMNSSNQHLDVARFELNSGTTLIEASAGTGKTYTIQYIVLDLLLKGLSLSEILVVTFTEAATKELADRLQSFLSGVNAALMGAVETSEASLQAVLDRAVAAQGEEAVQRCIRKAMLDIDQAAIYTIHGFCQRALQENAFAADANFDSELCADVSPIVEELVMDFLRRVNLEMPNQPPSSASLGTLMSRGLDLTGMLRIKNPFDGDLSSLGQELGEAAAHVQSFAGDADAILAEFLSYEGQLNGNSYKKVYFERFESLLQRIFRDPLSENLNKLGPTSLEKGFKKVHKGTELQSGFFAACEALVEVKENYGPSFLQCFDTWFIAAFQRIKQERGLMTYNDMILDLDRALRLSEPLKSQLRQRYRAALVDEFQDTDDRQYSIFKTLFASVEPTKDGPYFAMIGDPKQSIYGFRGADISAYLEARDDAKDRYTLPMNFRSEDAMVSATNAFFKGGDLGAVMPGTEADSIAFDPVTAADKTTERLVFSGDDQPSRLYERALDYPEDNKVKTAHESSAREMARDVQRLLSLSSEGRVYFKSGSGDDLKRRPVHEGDIAVLVDSHKEAAIIQREFQQFGILAVRAKTGSILESEEAKDFLYFLMACLNPQDRTINYLLVGALYGKNDAEMKALSDVERRGIYELFTLLGHKWREGAAVSLLWMQFLDSLSAREGLLRKRDGERRLTNYLHIAEYAQELERTESLSPERLRDRMLEAMQGGVESSANDENLVRLESDGRAVKVMTMHSSKGLEFPIVFLPSLWQKGVKGISKKDERLLTESNDPDSFDRFEVDKDLVVAQSSAENLRLGYVAITRAVHFCVYYNVRDLPKQHGQSNQADGWFDQWLYEQRDEQYPTKPNQGFLESLSTADPVELDAPDDQPEVCSRSLKHPIPHSYQITSYSSLARSEVATADSDPSVAAGMGDRPVEQSEVVAQVEEVPSEPDLLLEAFPGGVRTGTCVHEVLERCDFTQPEQWPRVAGSVIARNFPDGGELALEQRVAQVVDLIERLTNVPWCTALGQSIDLSQLSPQACIPEMEFYFPVDQVDVAKLESIIQSWGQRVGLDYQPTQYRACGIDGYLTGSVDLFFTQDGRYTLLDWKTNRPLRNHAKLQRSYDRAGMHEHMSHGRYYLQALIYSVATSAYLRQRLGARFDWETHIGGFVYCYVRGVGEGTGWLHESFNEAEVLAAAEALGQTAGQKGIA